VIVAAERAARPHTFPSVTTPAAQPPLDCPFCAAHERMTPPEIARTGAGKPETPGWRVRVVPNLFPVVGGDQAGEGATGVHEVVVLSPAHSVSFGRLDDEQATEALTVMRDRVRAHLDAGGSYVQALINHGVAAGASIEHPHAQVVALDLVPPAVELGLARVDAAGHDLVAEAVSRAPDDRLAVIEGPAVAWCPRASGTPYQIRVAHRSTRAAFEAATDAEVRVVAIATRDALARLAAALGDVPYNLVVRTAPPGRVGFFHWYLDVLPKISVVAGFEQGTGILVNIVPPEHAVRRLTEVVP
jgi:UDPglucose--hexose-1-phosphate uridylyltransferase